MPRSRWAFSTAIHSCRSSTILCSGDQIAARSAPAYRVARTLGTVTGAIFSGARSGAPERSELQHGRPGPVAEPAPLQDRSPNGSDPGRDVRAPLGAVEADRRHALVGAGAG